MLFYLRSHLQGATLRRGIEGEYEISSVFYVYMLRNRAQKAQLLRFPQWRFRFKESSTII